MTDPIAGRLADTFDWAIYLVGVLAILAAVTGSVQLTQELKGYWKWRKR